MLSGRNNEKRKLLSLLEQDQSELISIVGRRRVGKTFLIKNVYVNSLIFSLTGIKDANKSTQLENFTITLEEAYGIDFKIQVPEQWLTAFQMLKKYISKVKTSKKKVIFLDEFPWLASARSGFLEAFDHFWNSWAVDQNIIVVICGSAATWMIENVVNNTGGLHNRVTQKINLKPFTLRETEQYCIDKKINIPRYDIISIYMAIGGIPFYLKEIERGDSAITAIDRICFGPGAPLKDEFKHLYQALFKNYKLHVEIITALASKQKGLTRKSILEITNQSSGGGFTQILRELEESSFIDSYMPFNKKERDVLYRLTDEFSLFYLKYMNKRKTIGGTWQNIALSQSVRSWSGYVFENICFKHVDSIKIELGIHGIYSEESSFIYKGKNEEEGVQVDLLIDRRDNAINLCEAKFYNTEFKLNAAESKKLRRRKALFQLYSKTKKQIITTLISTYGTLGNDSAEGVDKIMTMDCLFHNIDA